MTFRQTIRAETLLQQKNGENQDPICELIEVSGNFCIQYPQMQQLMPMSLPNVEVSCCLKMPILAPHLGHLITFPPVLSGLIETRFQGHPYFKRFLRVHMDSGNPVRRFPGEPGSVVVIDIAYFGVKDVEHIHQNRQFSKGLSRNL